MKKTATILLVFSIGLIVLSCQRIRLVHSSISDDGKLRISLNFLSLAGSLTMEGDKGAFFFQTKEDTIWINTRPSEEEFSDSLYRAKWVNGNREIAFEILRRGDDYNFSFKAKPSADILKWGFGLSATSGEYFTGLYERTVDGDQKKSWQKGIDATLNLRGETVDMIIKPTLSLYTPFYLSSRNYGMFVEGTWPGHYDFCKSDPGLVQIEFEGPSLSGIFYTSNSPADIVKRHSLNVGPATVPPKWAFMPWRWRDNHDNFKVYYDGTPVKSPYNSQVAEDILMMEAYDIPCGVYWVDRPWARGKHGYEDFEWNSGRFPDAGKMIDWIHSRDMKFLLWIAPWVAGNMKDIACKKGYTIPMKKVSWGVDSTNAALLDFTNIEACRWWQKSGLEKVLRQGVDGFKLDRSEELVPETRDIYFTDGRTARQVRNEYPVLYARTVNESCRKIHGNDFVLITRAGYAGSSKYTSFWGGDIGTPQEGLRTAIIALQRSSVIGFPIWGSDIGGYWQGNLDREVFARWLAFGCFSPIMEVGPTEDVAPWSMKSEPHYDAGLIAIWRLYAKLHAALADYSYNHALEAKKTGIPVVRPLFLQYPEQESAWNDWQTFLYGSDILVSAIWQKVKTSHRFYLPAGARWINAWEKDEVYEGGQWIEMETPLYKIPLFVRKGASVDLGDLEKLYRESLDLAQKKPDLAKLEKKSF